eukprot:TRINITY_DN4040_c0_g1_i8.p1 TRINITY_DN4040_c0_g1~~TRINITY_DN4040_c0_g1_i8.p1  ORF type:complete len:387 (-),score=48.90 TRINITY_DN4040_c0_g1_i8:50-1210(-)
MMFMYPCCRLSLRRALERYLAGNRWWDSGKMRGWMKEVGQGEEGDLLVTTTKDEHYISTPVWFPNLRFTSLKIDQISSTNTTLTFYVTGWGDDANLGIKGFFVGKGKVDLGKALAISLDIGEDVSSPPLVEPCYDIFTEVSKPLAWTDPTSLYVVITGRCSTILKTSLINPHLPFKGSLWRVFDPTPTDAKHIPSADYDPETGILYYSIQGNGLGDQTYLVSFNYLNFLPLSKYLALEVPRGKVSLRLSNTSILNVFVSGVNQIFKFSLDKPNHFTLLSAASLPDQTGTVSSTLYIKPYLYWTTYEISAMLGRVHDKNFCRELCPDRAFCQNNVCECDEGWEAEPDSPVFSCLNKTIVRIEKRIISKGHTTIAFSVLLFLTSLTGI